MAKLLDGEERVEKKTKKNPQPKFKRCCNCGELVDAILAETIDGKTYCKVCAAPILKRIEKDKQAYKNLMSYLKDLNDGNTAYLPMYAKQIKRLRENKDHEFKVTGILATLKYMFEICEPKVTFYPDNVINMIPRYYPQAEKYNIELFKIREFNKRYDPSKDEEIIITVSRRDLEEQDRIYKEKRQLIDFGPELRMEDIEITEEDLLELDDE